MAAVTICSDFGASQNKVSHCFHRFPIYFPWRDGMRCHDLRFLNAEFLNQLSTLLFYFHQEALQFLFTFCHKGGVICVSEVIDISPGNLDSSLWFIQPGVSHDAPIETSLNDLVLQIIKESQQQHGLRHGDFQRYRLVSLARCIVSLAFSDLVCLCYYPHYCALPESIPGKSSSSIKSLKRYLIFEFKKSESFYPLCLKTLQIHGSFRRK